MRKHNEVELKSFIFQDGTYSLTGEQKLVDELFAEFRASIIEIEHKFKRRTINICQIPAVKSGPNSRSGRGITE